MSTRQQILDAAERVMQARGLTGATTKEIAKEAGYAEGTIYNHFANKQELLVAVLQENLPSFVSIMQGLLERAGENSVGANLKALAQAVISYYQKIVPLSASFFADPELLNQQREWMREHGCPLRLHQRVEAYIKLEQELGRCSKQINAMGAATLLLGACMQYVFLREFMGENPMPMPEQEFVTNLVQTLIAGLAPKAE